MDTLVQSPDRALYETDEHAWLARQVELLRDGNLHLLDRDSLIDLLESMGRRDIRQLRRRFVVLLSHLLKMSRQSERHTRSWNSTVLTQQRELRSLLQDWPSLAARREEFLAETYPDAVALAAAETGLPVHHFPPRSPWTADEALAFQPPYPPAPVTYRQKR